MTTRKEANNVEARRRTLGLPSRVMFGRSVVGSWHCQEALGGSRRTGERSTPARLGAPPPVSGGLLRATPRPSTGEPFPSPPLAPRLGWDRYDDRTGMRCLRARSRGRPWGAWRTTLAATCYTTGTAATPSRTTMQGPGAECPHPYETPAQVDRQPWTRTISKGKTVIPCVGGGHRVIAPTSHRGEGTPTDPPPEVELLPPRSVGGGGATPMSLRGELFLVGRDHHP